MDAYTRISLPVNKLNVSSPEGDDKKTMEINNELAMWASRLEFQDPT